MNKVFFAPWIGSNYVTGGIFNKKILVVGESHYCGGCDFCGLTYNDHCEDLTTTKCISNYLDSEYPRENWTKTFLKFERSLVNKVTTHDDSVEIWNSVAFFNFLQVAMTESRKAGSPDDYKLGAEAFLEIINKLEPELIIVWGVTRMYNNLPSEGWMDGDSIIIDGYKVLNGFYKLKSSHVCRTINVYHPSVGYDWTWWYDVIQKFM